MKRSIYIRLPAQGSEIHEDLRVETERVGFREGKNFAKFILPYSSPSKSAMSSAELSFKTINCLNNKHVISDNKLSEPKSLKSNEER